MAIEQIILDYFFINIDEWQYFLSLEKGIDRLKRAELLLCMFCQGYGMLYINGRALR